MPAFSVSFNCATKALAFPSASQPPAPDMFAGQEVSVDITKRRFLVH